MRALAYLLGARELDAADAAIRNVPAAEESLAPMATTPERAAAWRRWAEGGRSATSRDADADGSEPALGRGRTSDPAATPTPAPTPAG